MKNRLLHVLAGKLVVGGLLFFHVTWGWAAALPEAVPWPQLGVRLAEKRVAMLDLPVIDCPLGLADEKPDHLVIQVIENTLYEWKEYEFFTADGEVRLALEMIRPEARRLRADEAQILLNASRLVEIDNDYAQGAQAESQFSRTGIIGQDDLIKVTDTTGFPWHTIAFIDAFWEPTAEWYSYSGFMISPYAVVTTAWALYDFDVKTWYRNFVVIPGAYYNQGEQRTEAPFGRISNCNKAVSSAFHDTGKSEYSYGVLLLKERFPGIDTFMALEFDYEPTRLNYAGYPGYVKGAKSWDMWGMGGHVLGYEGLNNRLMKTDIDITNGGYGGPLYIYNSTTKARRVVAVSIWNNNHPNYNSGARLVSANKALFTDWLQYVPPSGGSGPAYDNYSYVPYLSNDGAAGRWTGLALTNRNGQVNQVKVEYFSRAGLLLNSETKEIAANGQTSFAAQVPAASEGWIKLSSTEPLQGLALVGQSRPESMFDMDLKTTLHSRLKLAHLAADAGSWNSLVMICNPNDSPATITYKAYNTGGGLVATRSGGLAARGSVQTNLYTLFGQALAGSMIIEATQPITAFLLYDSKTTVWKAGLSAIPVQ
ncbi:MAG TPA: hypothetical protein ENN66_02755 [Proteobacteria bacterium]|nr:hypothetical protein [Pseudomonadota bacterium]